MGDVLEAEAESIIHDICTAFSEVRRGPLSLHQAMIAKSVTADQLADAAALDKDQRWEEIPDADLETAGRAFYGADPISWRYFLPAFMRWSLRYFRVNQSFVCDQTIYTFDLSDDDDQLHRSELERFATLSPPQCKAVCRFLRYMARNGDHVDDLVAQHALDAYWGKFCEADGA
jgi:hypothetical protein